MDRKFNERVRLTVYLDAEDYKALRKRCGAATVSGYVREMLGVGWVREELPEPRKKIKKLATVNEEIRQEISQVAPDGKCEHDYGPKACPFSGCKNYKWRD